MRMIQSRTPQRAAFLFWSTFKHKLPYSEL
jgi:hypothetical protein